LPHRLALIISQNVPVNPQRCRRVGVTELPLRYRRACGVEKHACDGVPQKTARIARRLPVSD